MKQPLFALDEILNGYDAVSQIYPFIPSMCIWRAWEYAAYRRYQLTEPVLDIGCGDGHFFRLVWPALREVVGIDTDPGVVEAARRSGVYREIYHAPAHRLPEAAGSFGSAFANCSLEHMDNLPQVLQRVRASLRPGGTFLLSVVTDKFLEWDPMPLFAEAIANDQAARALKSDYVNYHHLVNPISAADWTKLLEDSRFEVVEHMPIVPEVTSRVFLFFDHLWHIRFAKREAGDRLFSYFSSIPQFPQGFRKVLAGILKMEVDWETGSGAIFWAQSKP